MNCPMKKHYRKRKTSLDNKMNYTPLLKFQIKSTQCSLNAQLPGKQTEELARDKSKAMPGKLRELSIKLKLSPFYKTIHNTWFVRCCIYKVNMMITALCEQLTKHKAQSSRLQGKKPAQSSHTDLHREPRWLLIFRLHSGFNSIFTSVNIVLQIHLHNF